MRIPVLSTMLLSSLVLVPANAQAWRLQPRVQREIQSDISGLGREIDRAVARRTIALRDAAQLRRDTAQLKRTFSRLSRNGLDRGEVEQFEERVNNLRTRLKLGCRDWVDRR